MRERLSALDVAATSAQAGQLDTVQHSLAVDAAHKFAGSLGMFGFPEGTEAAREIEHRLLAEEELDSERLTHLIRRLHQLLQL